MIFYWIYQICRILIFFLFLDFLSQQPNRQEGSGNENPQLPPPPPQAGSLGSIRPGSMADRARVAKIPQPETALKCPRCESTNTKFCYFNNYSLTQPRHFCKTCRRYWTRGGALRNVPVGGGCRRNKKSKSSSSKSPASAERHAGSNSTSAIPSSGTAEVIGHLPKQASQLPFMPTLQNLTQYGIGNMSLNFGGNPPHIMASSGGGQNEMGFHIGSNSVGLSAEGVEQWRLQQVQQFPFLGSFEPPTGLYPFQNEDVKASSSVDRNGHLPHMVSGSGVAQLTAVKLLENQGLNLSRQFLDTSENNQYWVGNAWTDFSGLNSSSTSNRL